MTTTYSSKEQAIETGILYTRGRVDVESNKVSIMMSVDDEGVKAIIYLQALVGIEEPVERATRGWNSLADWEKEQTLRLYKSLRNDG